MWSGFEQGFFGADFTAVRLFPTSETFFVFSKESTLKIFISRDMFLVAGESPMWDMSLFAMVSAMRSVLLVLDH